jgi:hypothetical protein
VPRGQVGPRDVEEGFTPKVDAHSTVPLQEPAPDEVLGQAPPGFGGGLGQVDGHVNDDPSEEHDASLPVFVDDKEEEGDEPSTDWSMGPSSYSGSKEQAARAAEWKSKHFRVHDGSNQDPRRYNQDHTR